MLSPSSIANGRLRFRRALPSAGWLLALLAFAGEAPAAQPPRQPGQPASGPGGSDYAHASVSVRENSGGGKLYHLFLPAEPAPSRAPVVVFLHGWAAIDPAPYAGWIEHLARKGAIVVYPHFHTDLVTPTDQFTPNTLAALRAAFDELERGAAGVTADTGRVALVGHALGGLLAANLATEMPAAGLPTPAVVMCVQPGNTWGLRRLQYPLADLSRIHADTLMLVVVSDRDTIVGDLDARRIYKESTAVPATNKDLLVLMSDFHGQPRLDATHFTGAAPKPGDGANSSSSAAATAVTRDSPYDVAAAFAAGEATTDALDYRGTWRLFDALCGAAWRGESRAQALGGSREQLDMGTWSDGRPVTPLRRIAAP